MTEWKSSRPPHPLFLGLALVALGAVFILREFGVVPDVSVWTLLWLTLGSSLFIGTIIGRRRGWFWPLSVLLIGVVMLLRDLDIIDSDFAIWPIVVFGLGLSIVIEAVTWNRRAERTSDRWWEIDG